jgi:hypothetical protein
MTTRAQVTEHGVMLFEVRGLVTPETGGAVVAQLDAAMRQHRPRGMIADYRGACMAADPRTMVAKMERGLFSRLDWRTRVLGPPGVALVSPGALDLWKEYSALMGLRLGLLRDAFSEAETALSWLLKQAAIRDEALAQQAAAHRVW